VFDFLFLLLPIEDCDLLEEHLSCLALPPTSIYSDLVKMFSANHLTDVVVKVRNGEIKGIICSHFRNFF
jgi:hypothetical protein